MESVNSKNPLGQLLHIFEHGEHMLLLNIKLSAQGVAMFALHT